MPKLMNLRAIKTSAHCLILTVIMVSVIGTAAAQQVNPETVCAACHGLDGNSSTPIWPKLAGQHSQYIARQTKMVRDGQRSIPEMLGIVAGLSDAQIDAAAAYFGEQNIQPGVADEALVGLGKKIYQTGLQDKSVAACQACHGPVGSGNPLALVPALAGQHADYTKSRLQRYRDGLVNGEDDSYGAQMVTVAKNLNDAEIEALASYLEGLFDSRQTAGN